MTCFLSQEQIDQTITFHGHWCPGLTYGIRAAEWALSNLCGRSEDEELVAVVETDMCAVDAIQFLTGCTFGKGNLIHLDYGKSAFTFYHRADEKAARLVIRPDLNPEDRAQMSILREKQQQSRLTPQEETRINEIRDHMAAWLMAADLEEIFDIQPTEQPLPQKARIVDSLTCEACGESVMETRTRRFMAQTLCIPCFDHQEKR